MKIVRHLTLTLEYKDGAGNGEPEYDIPHDLILRDGDAVQIGKEVTEQVIAFLHESYAEQTGFLDGYFFADMTLTLSDDQP